MIAVFLRKNYALLPFALLNPFYWLLHSIAAYKAAAQLITNPFYWEKTQHGLAVFTTNDGKMKHVLAPSFALAAFAYAATSSAYADDPKNFIAVNQAYYATAKGIDNNGAITHSPCQFNSHAESVYVAHTMTLRDLWYADTAYYNLAACGSQTKGLSDIELGYQRGISTKKAPNLYAVRASVTVPTGYSIETNPRLGLGRPALNAGMAYTGGFYTGIKHKHYGFVTLGISGKVYTGYPAPQMLSNAGAGYGLTPNVLVIESYFGATHTAVAARWTNIGINPTAAVYDSYAAVRASSSSSRPTFGHRGRMESTRRAKHGYRTDLRRRLLGPILTTMVPRRIDPCVDS